MPRKKIFPELSVEDRFDEMIVEAIWGTTIEMRERIARAFEAGQISPLMGLKIPKSSPEALLVASLVDADSPLVFVGEKLRARRLVHLIKPLSKLDQFAGIYTFPQTAHRSVEKTRKSVDNSALPVDKSVEKSVEKSTQHVDNLSTIYAFPHIGSDFSTSCGKVADPSPKLSTCGETVDKSGPSLFKDSQAGLIPHKFSTVSTTPTTTTIPDISNNDE
jgi:hypothetical protein